MRYDSHVPASDKFLHPDGRRKKQTTDEIAARFRIPRPTFVDPRGPGTGHASTRPGNSASASASAAGEGPGTARSDPIGPLPPAALDSAARSMGASSSNGNGNGNGNRPGPGRFTPNKFMATDDLALRKFKEYLNNQRR
jgi:hypothetical protein